MNNTVFGKTAALVLALIFVMGLIPPMGFAGSNTGSAGAGRGSSPDVKGFEQSVFDYHFSRADRELSPDQWLFEARRGIDMALYAWELFAPDLYDNPLLLNDAKKQIEAWSADELEARFSQWLSGRFFGEAAEQSAARLSALMSETQTRLTYHLDDAGNVLYDAATGDPLVIRPGEEGRDFESDRAQWREDAQRHIAAETGAFETAAVCRYPELLAFVPEERRDSFSAALTAAVSASSAVLQREFEGLAAREERLFTGRRTGDVWSLRKKSDDEAAGAVITQLIGEAGEICANGIAALTTRIEEAAAGTGDLVLMGSEWLQMYREQFDRGLKAWEEAEERFFIRRVEWEQEAGRLFSQGEETWLAAFDRLSEERTKWELQSKALFESGETLFQQASDNLEAAIAEAKIEFEYNLRMRTGTGTERAKALVETYLTCGSAAVAARDNAQFWITQYSPEGGPDITDDSIYDWLAEARRAEWTRAEAAYRAAPAFTTDQKNLEKLDALRQQDGPNKQINETAYQNALEQFNTAHHILLQIQTILSGGGGDSAELALINEINQSRVLDVSNLSVLAEAKTSVDLYRSYMDKTTEARERIIADYNGIMGSGALKDILADDVSTEDFVLDEYQIALVQARAVARYWERRTAIAEAVSAYAGELTAGRMTEAESLAQWNDAKAAYDGALVQYEEELQRLNVLGAGIEEKKNALEQSAQQMQEAEAALNRLTSEYSTLIAVNTVNRGDYLLSEFNARYEELLAEYTVLRQSGGSEVYRQGLEYALRIDAAQNRRMAGAALAALIAGDDEGLQSLAALREAVEQIRVFDDDAELPGAVDEYGLAPEDPRRQLIERLLAERDALLAAADDEQAADGTDSETTPPAAGPSEADSIKLRYNSLIRGLAAAAKAEAGTALALRLAAIQLFADSEDGELRSPADAYSGADWYNAARGETAAETSLAGSNLRNRLADDAADGFEALLERRLALETEALACFLDDASGTDSPGALLSYFCAADRAAAEQGLAVLRDLTGRLRRGEGYFSGDGETDMLIHWFISGGSFFAASEAFLVQEMNNYRRGEGLLDVYENFGGGSSFAAREAWAETLRNMEELRSRYNLFDDGDSFLPDMQTLSWNLLDNSGGYILNSAMFLRDFDQVFSQIPEWFAEEIETWKSAFIEFVALNALYQGITPYQDAEMFAAEYAEIESRYRELREYYNSLAFADRSVIQEVNRINGEIIADEQLLTYQYLIVNAMETGSNEADGMRTERHKHWRQYLKDSEITRANSIEEGMLLDALDAAAFSTARINDAARLFSTNAGEMDSDDPEELLERYYAEIGTIQRHLDTVNTLRIELARLGREYEYAQMAPDTLITEAQNKQALIEKQETVCALARNEYFAAAEAFAESGASYDEQYTTVKKAYENIEEKRFAYETQDAIRRWASTAYLEADTGDVRYCADRLERARIALSVLSDLYDGNVERRSYDNPEYAAVYAEYETSYHAMLVSLKALNSVNMIAMEETSANEKAFGQYSQWLHTLGKSIDYAADYIAPDDKTQWGIQDIVTIRGGMLAFSRDASMKLGGVDTEEAAALSDYFSANSAVDGERHTISRFEQALRGLNQRMAGYFQDSNQFSRWGLARDYLVRTLLTANKDIPFLGSKYMRAAPFLNNGSLKNAPYKTGVFQSNDYLGDYVSDIQGSIRSQQQKAWEGLSAAEQADLEMYVILTISGDCNDYISGFSQYTALEEYQRAYNKVKGLADKADDKLDRWWEFGFVYREMRDVNRSTYKRIQPSMEQTKKYIADWKTGLLANIARVNDYAAVYAKSCARLDTLLGRPAADQGISWDDINISLVETGRMSAEDCAALRVDWEAMLLDIGGTYSDVITGLATLAQWTRNRRDRNEQALDNRWLVDDSYRRQKEQEYFETVEAFIAGETGAAALDSAAREAYGDTTAAWKNHFEHIAQMTITNLGEFPRYGSDYILEFSSLGSEYAGIVAWTLTSRFEAELAAREAEWGEQRRDIMEKYREWRETAALILERGREDWKAGVQNMETAYRQWKTHFTEEHQRISGEWAVAYLAGLEDKEQWLAQASAAADQAASGAMLSAVGVDAERLARVMDTREPSGMRTADAVSSAEGLLAELLNSAGISGITGAFAAMNDMAGGLSATAVKRGLGGAGLWDAGTIRAAAADLSRETNAELAARESRKLAYSARLAAADAINSLSANVDAANANFRKSIDNLFIVQGQWRKSGKNYIKDIIVASTLFEPVITEEKRVAEFADYRMEPVELKTNLDDNFLAGLDSVAINSLIENVYAEINTIAAKIFGDGDQIEIHKTITEEIVSYIPELVTDPYTGETTVERKRQISTREIVLQDRLAGSGTFGAYIGYEPAVRPGASGKNRNALFYDQGAGEYGRLMSDFIYWSIIDSMGSAELSLAPWDKRMWDDSGSSFSAPSLRSVVDVTNQIGVAVISVAAAYFSGGTSLAGMAALMTAVSVADDFMFDSMDAGFGYKTIDEAGFEFGKAALISAVSNFSAGAFGGITSAAVQTAGSAVGKVAVQAAMTGAQTFTTGIATSAISGVTYNSETKEWGYSSELFANGVKGTIISTLSSVASAVTSGTLTSINSGMNMEKLTGFSVLNQKNIGKLNSLLGAVAGQGVQYAMGEDFTLNLLNTGLLSKDLVNSGLLELRFGHDGSTKMNIGTGGADVGINTLIGSVGGALVWNVNNRIDRYTASNNFDGKVMLRAQYGHGDQKQKGQLWNILNGKDKLMITADGDYAAETEIVDGKRAVKLSGYQSGMSDAEQMALAVILGHEAYRDGIVADDNYLETRNATLAHTQLLKKLLSAGETVSLNSNLMADLMAYDSSDGNIDAFNTYVDSRYDSSADYWKLTKDGSLEYDGFATLRDADGNTIKSWKDMNLKSDNSIEGALLYLMGVDSKDTKKVAAVRTMMEQSGILHSFNKDPEQWLWKGEYFSVSPYKGAFSTNWDGEHFVINSYMDTLSRVQQNDLFGITDITSVNMGKTVSIASMANLFNIIGATGNDIIKSVNRIYGSAIDFLNYADTGGRMSIANTLLSKYYSQSQLAMVQANRDWLNESLKNGVDINNMVVGNVRRTEEFGVNSGELKLASSSVQGASYFQEDHTGIDFGSGGSSINGPGGYWQLIDKIDHRAYYQLYGGDLKMRVQHVNPNELSTIALNSTIYGGSNNKLLNYPSVSYGTGTGAHIHIDMTMRLPYNGRYVRQFVNPETLQTGNRFEYQYSYKDAEKKSLPDYPKSFIRY
jgi:hypothetical protein